MKQFLFMLIAMVSTVTIAQNYISGQVTINDSSEPIPYANIYFPQLEKGTTTDDNGNFTINNLPSGVQKITISVIGFETFFCFFFVNLTVRVANDHDETS